MKTIPAIIFPIAATLALLTSGCGKSSDTAQNPKVVPVVTTAPATDIGQRTASCGGTVIYDGGTNILARGVCWGTASNIDISGQHTNDGSGTGAFVSLLDDLYPNTKFYYKAYATNVIGTSYGSVMSFTTRNVPEDSVTDVDGNTYHVVPIGTQKWLKENLRVTRYRNGDAVPEVKTDAQWKVLANGAYCRYDNLPANGEAYGLLYNWHALGDSRGLCPSGWHVPSNTEWEELGAFLGGLGTAGGAMKSTGTIEAGTGPWYAPNTEATNSSGFTGLPGGYRINYGTFYSVGNVGYFWSVSDTAADNAWNYVLDANNAELKRIFNFKTNGFSIRCCKD